MCSQDKQNQIIAKQREEINSLTASLEVCAFCWLACGAAALRLPLPSVRGFSIVCRCHHCSSVPLVWLPAVSAFLHRAEISRVIDHLSHRSNHRIHASHD
jgi:hypothetical protein